MKRIGILTMVALLVTAFSLAVMDYDATAAEKPKGTQNSGSFKWTTTVDSTVEIIGDTNSTYSGSSGKIALFNAIPDYSSISGFYVVEYTDVDTGTSGVDVDTTKDTVVAHFYTADDDFSPAKLVWTDTIVNMHVTAAITNADYVFHTWSDSALLTNLYVQLISMVQDSVYTKARLEAGLDWKFTWKYYAK